MKEQAWKKMARLAAVVFCACSAIGAAAQQPRQAATLTVAGQQDQAQLVHLNGRSYVDLESLARITHGSLQFEGNRAILTLPSGPPAAAPAVSSEAKPPHLTEGFLGAEIQALSQVREWHVSLVNAVNHSSPVTEAWMGPIRRNAEAKLQLALAAATSEPDQKAADLLRNEFANMGQISDQLLAMHDNASYISPDIFQNNALDAKILGCAQALNNMAASKQFQDDAQCH